MSKSILLLTDFSLPATKAAEFAGFYAEKLEYEKVIILHSYQTVSAVFNQPMVSTSEASMEIDKRKELANISDFLEKILSEEIEVETVLIKEKLENAINQILENEDVGMIVMGITGNNKFTQRIIGSSAAGVLESSKVPVLLVPFKAKINPDFSIVLATNFNEPQDKFPLETIQSLQSKTKGKLFVSNVVDHEELTESENKLKPLLGEEKVYYAFLMNDETDEAISKFADEKNANLIILIKKQYHFIVDLFRNSLTKELSYSTEIPLLIVPEKEL